MKPSHRIVPPLSPVLLAGLVLRRLPPALLQPALAFAMGTMRRRHSGLFERLSEIGNPLFLIDPIDLPYVFVLRGDPKEPGLTALADGQGVKATATIRGPLLSLIDLLEGRIDGDALFFSRHLAVEGDMEAVVALHNAIEGAEIDIAADLLSRLGPLRGPARRLAGVGGRSFRRLAEDLRILHRAMIGPVARRTDALADRLGKLDEAVVELKRRARQRDKRRPARS